MSWQRRLVELLAAGGTLAGCGDSSTHIPCGNANPDPCICNRMPPDTTQCKAEAACGDAGGTWEVPPFNAGAPDAAPGFIGSCKPAPGAFEDAATEPPPTDAPHD